METSRDKNQLTYDMLEFKLLLMGLVKLLPVLLQRLLVTIVFLVPEQLLEVSLV